VALQLIYLIFIRLLGAIALLLRSGVSKDAGRLYRTGLLGVGLSGSNTGQCHGRRDENIASHAHRQPPH
jgi:hypothetical protein